MQKRLGLTLFAGLAIIVAACGGGGASTAPSADASVAPSVAPSESAAASVEPSVEPSAALRPLKVGVVTDVGQLEDKSFNQSSNEGAMAAAEATGGEHDVIVTQSIADYGANIQTFVDQGFDVIVTVGFLHRDRHGDRRQGQPGRQVHRRRPGHLRRRPRASRTRPSPAPVMRPTLLPNYQGIVFAEAQPGYLAGIVAASLSESGTIGAVGGTNVPAVVNYWRGYENGAKSVKPDIEVLYQETDPDPAKGFNDPAKGRAIAEQFIGQGADVLFQIAGLTGQGVARGRVRCRPERHRRRRRPGGQPAEPRAVHRHQRREEARRHGHSPWSPASRRTRSSPGPCAYNAASTPPAIGLAPYHDNAAKITPEIQALIDTALGRLRRRIARSVRAGQVHGERQAP